MSLFIPVKNGSLNYIRFGKGERLLLCFHGFGEGAEKFRVLEPALGQHFTVLSFDLPFHGKSEWRREHFFYKEDLRILINEILIRENATRFSLMGNSLGGKIVLSAVELFGTQIDTLTLIAPDGVKNNAWYNVAVYPKWGQKLFARFVKRPQFVFSVARTLNAIGIVNDRLHKFLQAQTDTEEKRQKVYDVWLAVKDLECSLPHVKSLLNLNDIKSFIFIGKYDQVITPEIGKKFSDGLKNNSLVILEKGHNLVTESLNEPLTKALFG